MTSAAGSRGARPVDEQWLIKRYANRKLYDTVERRFTSLSRIRALVRDGVDVLVQDHDTGEDLTAETLSQALGRRRRDAEPDEDAPALGLLADLIRAPGKLARAVAEHDRGVDEIRDLRREVQALAETLDKLLEDKSTDADADPNVDSAASGEADGAEASER
jgi:hypothetical protein